MPELRPERGGPRSSAIVCAGARESDARFSRVTRCQATLTLANFRDSDPLEIRDFLAAERTRPALYMVYHPEPGRDSLTQPSEGYEVTSVPADRLSAARPIVELDGSLTDAQWNDFTSRVLPDGLFVA